MPGRKTRQISVRVPLEVDSWLERAAGEEGSKADVVRALIEEAMARERQDRLLAIFVVSTDAMNRSDFGTVIICPVTTRERPSFRWRPGLVPGDLQLIEAGWKPRPHWVATDQIVTVDTAARALRHLATVSNASKLAAVDEALRQMLAL